VFVVFEWREVSLLRDPAPLLGGGGPLAAALSLGLLIADVFVPVPSSVVMIANGALFGVTGGTLLSLAGSLGAAALGFFVGRRSARLIERLISPAEKAQADALLARWGALAIVVTRPIPLLAEATAILAGGSPLGWARLLVASSAGSFPSCLLYALTGAHSRSFGSFGSGAIMFAIVLGVAGDSIFLVANRLPDSSAQNTKHFRLRSFGSWHVLGLTVHTQGHLGRLGLDVKGSPCRPRSPPSRVTLPARVVAARSRRSVAQLSRGRLQSRRHRSGTISTTRSSRT
jgi:uncharacterized membrane protein YdjX (TVP38/TMEM64 family)